MFLWASQLLAKLFETALTPGFTPLGQKYPAQSIFVAILIRDF
jgi:hypothetical protein